MFTEKLRFKASHEQGKKSGRKAEHDLRMGLRGLPLLTELLRSAPYPIDQESGRKAEHDLGWDGEVSIPSGTLRDMKRYAFHVGS